MGRRSVSILDDHDHATGDTKLRYAQNGGRELQATAALAMQLFTLCIPCIYYGTEQAFAGPEEHNLDGWGTNVRYLREAMFGPEHPFKHGADGSSLDLGLPGFGPFGTSGHHCFNPDHPLYKRISRMAHVRREHPALRSGRQFRREISLLGGPFEFLGVGELVAWSRVLDDEEILVVVNLNGDSFRGGDILVDGRLSPGGLELVLNTADASIEGTRFPTLLRDGSSYVEIRDLPASECMVLRNHP
jgi:glycosidase